MILSASGTARSADWQQISPQALRSVDNRYTVRVVRGLFLANRELDAFLQTAGSTPPLLRASSTRRCNPRRRRVRQVRRPASF